jgi:hypothetical protein
MNGDSMTTTRNFGTLLLSGMIVLVPSSAHAQADAQPAMIPVAVAEAMSIGFGGGPIPRPRYFVGTVPNGWPTDLIPANAQILGGGMLSFGSATQMRSAVFAFSSAAEGREALPALLARAGYTLNTGNSPVQASGFLATPRSRDQGRMYCKDSSQVFLESLERTQGPNQVAVMQVSGSGARQDCSPTAPPAMSRSEMPVPLPVNIPGLEPPKGTSLESLGSSFSGESGSHRGVIRTTLAADSILFHYRKQLVESGWRAEGQASVGDGVAIQRFSFRERNEPWLAVLLVLVIDDQRDVEIRYMRAP